MVAPKSRKAVVVTFGGGARDDETFMLTGRRTSRISSTNSSRRRTFFTQVVNKGILGHYVATASIVTGVYEKLQQLRLGRP